MTTRVIVLNWNGRRWLDGCLTALHAQTQRPDEIVVVDNASTDDSVAHLRAQWPGVRVIGLPSNAGFAAGNNRGADDATTDYLIFLNNDTQAEPAWIERLVHGAEANPAMGMVTSCIVYLDKPDVVDSAGDGYLRCGGGFKYGHGQPAAEWRESREVFGACGAAFLIRRDLFQALRGFDESFFMVYEDVDLSYRAQLRGARVWYRADAVVRHAGSASMGRVSEHAVYHGQRNLEWTWFRNSPGRLLWRSLPAHVAYTIAGAAGYLKQGRFGPWCRGKLAAAAGMPRVLRERMRAPGSTPENTQRMWALMEPDWIARKRAEKRFDFK